MTTTQRIEITEGRPLSYTAHDGTVIVVSVAGPVEKIYTLTVNGQRELTHRNEDFVRSVARNIAEVRNTRWAEAMKAAAGTSVLIDDIAPLPAQITSPLVESERQSSGLAGPSGSAANAMSAPVRDMLVDAERHPAGRVYRGRRSQGRYPFTMLRAAARRGWLALGVGYAPQFGQLTDAGRKALTRELASTGGVR